MDLPVVVTLLVVAVVATAAVVTLAVALSRSRRAVRRLTEELGDARAVADRPVPAPAAPVAPTMDSSDFVITTLSDGADEPDVVAATADRSFASVAAGEALVRAASLVQGVRRALSAETRNRIRFEMAREVKRSRKQRRRDQREARRQPRPGASTSLVEEDAA
jgi:hypothetical protein